MTLTAILVLIAIVLAVLLTVVTICAMCAGARADALWAIMREHEQNARRDPTWTCACGVCYAVRREMMADD